MSASYGEARTERVLGATSTTGTIAEAAGSIAVIVLSIIGLAQTTTSATIVAVTAIVLGAALLAEGGALAGEFARLSLLSGESASADSIVSGMSLQVASGAIVLVLGILALLGVSAATLTAAAVIVVGAAMMLTASTIPQLRQLRSITSGGSEIVQMIGRTSMSGMAGAQFLAGVAAIVLGILALSSTAVETGRTLVMVGFLVVGGAMTIGVTAMSGNFLRFFTR
jgi:hypothetical protein